MSAPGANSKIYGSYKANDIKTDANGIKTAERLSVKAELGVTIVLGGGGAESLVVFS